MERTRASMKAYTYRSDECGLTGWPSGTLRLEGMEPSSPQDAELFICPGNLSLFLEDDVLNKERLYRLPYFVGNESRHVFFDVSDNFKTSIGLPILFIKCDARQWMLADDPGTIQMGWPVEDYAECVPVPEGGFKYDVSFQGWLSTATREQSSQSCIDNPNLKCNMARYSDFTGYIYHEPEGIRRRAEFRRSMRESRLALCPESIAGVFPYRFFEAMSAGRVPILVASDVVFPFRDEIPYEDFILDIDRDDAPNAGALVREFLNQHDDSKLTQMGQMARHYWEKYLDSRNWPALMSYAVQKKMRDMGLTQEAPVLCE